MTDRPCFGAGVQRHVVHLAAAAQRTPECLFLFRRRVEAEPVCPLGCRGVHASYDTMLLQTCIWGCKTEAPYIPIAKARGITAQPDKNQTKHIRV